MTTRPKRKRPQYVQAIIDHFKNNGLEPTYIDWRKTLISLKFNHSYHGVILYREADDRNRILGLRERPLRDDIEWGIFKARIKEVAETSPFPVKYVKNGNASPRIHIKLPE